jgi:hypothetical protein
LDQNGSDQNSSDLLHQDAAADLASDDVQDQLSRTDVAPEDGGKDLHDLADSDGPDLVGDAATNDQVVDLAPLTEAEATVLKSIFPDALQFLVDLFDFRRYFIAVGPDGPIGTAFPGTRYGFNSEVISVTGFDSAAHTVALEILQQWESWWFIVQENPAFFDQFKGLDTSKLNPATRDSGPYTIDAISGATYSSMAVIDGFWMAVDAYQKRAASPQR